MAKKWNQPRGERVRGEDVVRGITFTGFWGFVFYLLALLSMISGQRSQPFKLSARPVLLGLGLNVVGYVVVGLLGLIGQSFVRGKSSTEQSREDIGGGTFERFWWLSGLGTFLVAGFPFTVALVSLRAAEKLSGEQAFQPQGLNWTRALSVMGVCSGLVALIVARITSWVAQDAKVGLVEQHGATLPVDSPLFERAKGER